MHTQNIYKYLKIEKNKNIKSIYSYLYTYIIDVIENACGAITDQLVIKFKAEKGGFVSHCIERNCKMEV